MNQHPPTTSPALIYDLLTSRSPAGERVAAQHIVQVLQSPDPLARWGLLQTLSHTQLRLYYNQLTQKLQDQGQAEEVRNCAKTCADLPFPTHPATPATILREHARMRWLLKIASDLLPENEHDT